MEGLPHPEKHINNKKVLAVLVIPTLHAIIANGTAENERHLRTSVAIISARHALNLDQIL